MHMSEQTASQQRRADLGKSQDQVAAMFDDVSSRYDVMNALLSGGMNFVWLKALTNALAPKPSDRILDLAAGTGASSAEIARSGARVVACDLSAGMIEVGRNRHPDIEFVQGDAMDLPFEDQSFDAVTISYGLRNVPDPKRALEEMARVVRPGGRLVVCEFSTPTSAPLRAGYSLHLQYVMPLVARLASSDDVAYDYLAESIREWPDAPEVAHLIAEAGWSEVQYRYLTGGIVALHRAVKH
jgi:methionine biosynthesis protein metW